jgi:hypothetical protein
LDGLENEVFCAIQASFRTAPKYGVPTSELSDIRYRISNEDATGLFLRNPRTGGGRFIEGEKRVYVLSHAEWIANTRLTDTPMNIGRYLYEPAVILLHGNGSIPVSWCRNTLIHETFHSISLYSRIWNIFPGILSRHLSLIEGITECLTGYVLFKRHPDCYAIWKSNARGKCAVAYRESTRLFCSLSQLIGIDPIANLYLSLEREFSAPWNRFIESVHSASFNSFNYALNEGVAFREPLFREQCVKSITGFKKIYDSESKSLDFSQIP